MEEDIGFYFKGTPDKVKAGIKEVVEDLEKIMAIGEDVIRNIKFKDQKDQRRDVRTVIILSLFKEILERIDGVLILIEKYSIINAHIILRSFFEICLDLKIILSNPGRQKPCYYLLGKKIEELRKLELLKTEDLKEEWEDVQYFINMNKELSSLRKKTAGELKENFAKKKWYNFGGKNKYKKTDEDKILYGRLCKEVHGENSIVDNRYNSNNQFELRALRFPEKYQLSLFTISFNMLHTIELLREEYPEIKEEHLKELKTIFERSVKSFETEEKNITRE